jgi:hypothetical protein
VLCAGPGHSPLDRSLSVWFDGGSYRVHSFADDDFAKCRDHVFAKLGAGFGHNPQPKRIALPHENEDNLHGARHLWSCRRSARGTVVEKYLATRGIRSVPNCIGYLPPGRFNYPAMIACFGCALEQDGADGDAEIGKIFVKDVRGVHVTLIEHDGSGKAKIDNAKIMLGPSCSFPIVLAQPVLVGDQEQQFGPLAICEGIEDGLSIHQATGMGVWVAGSAGRMAALATRIPGYIDKVSILADNDDIGKRCANRLYDALTELSIEVTIL